MLKSAVLCSRCCAAVPASHDEQQEDCLCCCEYLITLLFSSWRRLPSSGRSHCWVVQTGLPHHRRARRAPRLCRSKVPAPLITRVIGTGSQSPCGCPPSRSLTSGVRILKEP